MPEPKLDSRIVVCRGHHVMLDEDLAAVYDVSTRALNQAIRRHRDRFPPDFAFQLSREEFKVLRSQIVISKDGRGGRRHAPWVFTEHGAIMAGTLLRGWRAVELSVYVVRAFIRLRQLSGSPVDVAARLAALERRVAGHDADLKSMFAALRTLIAAPASSQRRIGFEHWRGGQKAARRRGR